MTNKNRDAHQVSAGRRLWLVRHGQTLWNEEQRFCGHSDVALSRPGLAQARWLATCLSTRPISALYSSDLSRAHETALLIAEMHPQPPAIRTLAAWREIDFGAWEGLTYAEIAARFPAQLGFFNAPESSTPPGGETLADLRQRVLAALAQILEECATLAEGEIVIVSHGGPLRLLLSSILAMPLARQWQLALEPGSLSALDLAPGQDPLAPLGTLALLNMQRSLAPLLFPQEIHTSKDGEL